MALTKSGCSLLHAAAESGSARNILALRSVLDAGAFSSMANCANAAGATPLTAAAAGGQDRKSVV